MTSQTATQPAGADLRREELVKQALDAMAALGLIVAPQKVSEDYTQGFRQQTIDGVPSSSNQSVEYWKADTAHRVANIIESAQALANSIATRDYFLAGPTVEVLREQLAAVKSKIDASVPGDQDDRNYGNLWVQAMDLQVRIEAAE